MTSGIVVTGWVDDHPDRDRLAVVIGSAAEPAVAEKVADSSTRDRRRRWNGPRPRPTARTYGSAVA